MRNEYLKRTRNLVQFCPPGSNPPHVEAHRCGVQVRVMCPYCGREHYHGAAVLGHRLAHCGARAGYVLTVPKKPRP